VGTVGEQWWNYGGTVGTAAALWGKGVLGGVRGVKQLMEVCSGMPC
jgi:hypothetical protein